MDISDFFGQAQQAVSEGLDNLKEQALPALEAAATKYGEDWLHMQNAQAQAKVDENIKKMANSPAAPPGSFMAALQATLGGAATKAYAPMILLAIGGIVVVTLVLAKKGK